MKRYLIAALVAGSMLVAAPVLAVTIFQVQQGGTGVGTLGASQLVTGNGTNAVYTTATTSATCTGNTTCSPFTVIGSSPITISSSGAGGSFPFSADTNFGQVVYSTSTPTLWFKSGLFASSTSWFNNLQILAATSASLAVTGSTTISGALNSVVSNLLGSSTLLNNTLLTNATTTTFAITGGLATNCNGTNALTTTSSGTVNCTAQPQGTVTSITAGTGLNGGTITNTGTITLKSYIATSSAETSGQLAYWTSTSGTPATLGKVATTTTGTVSSILALNSIGFTTIPFASSTAQTISGELNIPHSSTVPSLNSGDLYVNTNSTASSSIATNDGTNTHTLFAVHSFSMVAASSTLAYNGAFGASGTTTLYIANPLHSTTLKSFFCKTDTGTAWVGFGTGSATTTEIQCTNTGVGVTVSSNNTWTGRQSVLVDIGRSGSSPNNITITADVEDSN